MERGREGSVRRGGEGRGGRKGKQERKINHKNSGSVPTETLDIST